LTSVEPAWLLKGTGPRYRTLPPVPEGGGSEPSVQALLRTALEYLERRRGQATARPLTPGTPGGKRSATGRDGPQDPSGESDDQHPPSERAMPPLGSAVADLGWQAAYPSASYVRSEGNAMIPVVADGAFVAYAETEEPLDRLEGCLVVAWLQGRPLVRWF